MRFSSKVLASTALAVSLSLASLVAAVPSYAAETGDAELVSLEETDGGDLASKLDAFNGNGFFDGTEPQSLDVEADPDAAPLSEQDLLDSEESATTESIPTYTLVEGEANGHNDGQLVRYNFTLTRTDNYLFMLKMYLSNPYWTRYGGVFTIYKKGSGSDTKVFQSVITSNFDKYKYTNLTLGPGEYYLDCFWSSSGMESIYTAYFILIFQGDNYKKASGTTQSTQTSSSTTMIRLYNPYSGEHLYTANNTEINKLVSIGWKNEGVAWTAPKKSSTPVYRLYNKYSGDHHYTTSSSEYEACAKAGWTKEGIAWFSDDAKGVPLYRGYNRYVKVGTHHYTTSWTEMETMKKNGWKYEGVSWYGLK